MRDRYDQIVWFLRFWRQHWRRIVFRLHKDRRALSAVLLPLGIVAYVVYYGFLLVKQPFSLVLLALGLAGAFLIGRSNAKDEQSFIRLSQYQSVEGVVPLQLVYELRSRMLRLALLVWRAGSEANLRQNHTAAGHEVITRRVILDKVNELGLRGSLDAHELDLHLSQDGSWPVESISDILMKSAELQVLQYCVGMDRFLAPIEDLCIITPVNTELLRGISTDPAWQFQETYNIRSQRDEAAVFYLRCLSEQRRRGLGSGDLNEELQVMLEAAGISAGDESRDLLLGTKTITDVETQQLTFASAQTYVRFKALSEVLELVEKEAN